MSPVARLVIVFLVFACGLSAVLSRSEAGEDAAFIRVGANTLIPFGWADFCVRYKGECDGKALTPVDIAGTSENFALFDRINRTVNARIKPKSDVEHWNTVDRWDLPEDGLGDCEDYVLLKRKLLIQAGLPRQALLVTIVRDEMGEGHAVLTVKTSRGELVLDNMTDEIKLWSRTPYRYVKRQSQEDQNVWLAIGAPTQMVAR